jgi:hypothetical protein
MTRRWIIITVAIAIGMSLTAVAHAHHGSQSSAPLISTTGAIDAIHASPPTWGTDGRPEYSGIAFAPDGTLYAVDALNGRVYKVTEKGPLGQTTVVAGSGPGVSLGKGGFQHWKQIKNHGWITVGSYGGDGQHWTDALFSGPFYLTFDAAGNMYVADHLNGRIRELSTDGFVSTVAGTGDGGPTYGTWTPGVGPAAGDGGLATHSVLNAPWGLTFDSHGNLFIADRDHAAIREVHTNGIITTVAGTGVPGFSGDHGLATQAKLNRPLTVAFDAAGNMYVDDENNRRIRMVDHTTGDITTVAGDGRYGCGGDGGQAIDASFKDPNEIGFAPDGSMLITDNECHNIRAIAPDGTISTLAQQRTSDPCKNIVGVDVSHLAEGVYAFGPDGELYVSVCNRIIRVGNNGITHLYARAPLFSNLPKP